MNTRTMILFAFLAMSLSMCGKGNGGTDPVPPPPPPPVDQPVMLADPFVLKHEGTYYMYGTSGTTPDVGIPVYQSADGKNWTGPAGKSGQGRALSKGESYGSNGFWAPEVFFKNGLFYMFYTANEHIAVATSTSPLGPFTQAQQQPLHDIKEIDPHVFVDDDGMSYLYFVRFDNGNKTYGAELNDDWKSIRENTLKTCITQSAEWEIVSGAQWPVTEAPAMLKHKNLYYLFYTANDFRSPAYNVGYATSPSPLGPFTKYAGSPIVPKSDNIQGTGHNAFVMVGSDLVMYYHAHNSPTAVGPRRTLFSTATFEAGPDGVDVLKINATKQVPMVKAQ